ncbi:MAG TPA: helix-turn-helix transcriptional regulator [Verrucomicrobiae bacterium]|jgi:transcriptional regulator with XRE-family HTH domain|nr:helix-turn-helix transcriptional regulator [Verrucomicrobiae bacterium]
MSRTKFTHADETFRGLLREIRERKGLSQKAVAVRLGLPQSYISKYELGERRLDFVETMVVCEALGTNLDSFLRLYLRRSVRPGKTAKA